MRSKAEREATLRLASDGATPGAISRLTGIPRSTVRDWVDGRVRPLTAPPDPTDAPAAAYAYLLGIYLGDGHLATWRKGLWHLRVACDAAYPGIADEIVTAIRVVRGYDGAVYRFMKDASRCLVVQSLWKHWPLYLPQHAPGRKHERPIVLTDWQRSKTQAEPGAFVRGLIHSDGCRYVARQRRREKIYTYVRYSLSNESEDIKDLFREHLDLLGVDWVTPNAHRVDVNRRGSVARLEELVGPKV